jgi:predicted dehydrogenase
MISKDERRLRIGVLGCGPIAQFAHFESCTKARNADLFAICDVAEDLVERMAWVHKPVRTYTDYDRMLADPDVEAVIVATADAFHVAACERALAAGKHVLCEKPIGLNADECRKLMAVRDRTGVKIGEAFMVRVHPQWLRARDLVEQGAIGPVQAIQVYFSYFNADPNNIRNKRDIGGGAASISAAIRSSSPASSSRPSDSASSPSSTAIPPRASTG